MGDAAPEIASAHRLHGLGGLRRERRKISKLGDDDVEHLVGIRGRRLALTERRVAVDDLLERASFQRPRRVEGLGDGVTGGEVLICHTSCSESGENVRQLGRAQLVCARTASGREGRHGANVFDVIELINRDYPRGGIARPGFTAGTCLRKNFAFSEERSHAPGMLLAVSRVNESVPLFLVEGMVRRLGSLSGKKVAVLGLAFKAGTDDERDSLAHKLVRLLERELADVAIHDPHVTTPTQSFDDAVAGADAIVLATNHPEFLGLQALLRITDRASPEALLVDPWDCFGAAQVFAYTAEIAVLSIG